MANGVLRFMKYASKYDIILMALGTVGSIGDGMSLPLFLLATSGMVGTLGSGPYSSDFIHQIHKYSLCYVYIAIAVWIAAFLEGFCWTKSAERQSVKLRWRYVKAVLMKEVGSYDESGTKAKVMSTLTSDATLVREVLSERVPSFLMNISAFLFGYMVSIYLSWRVGVSALPFIVILVIPGLLYGRLLIVLSQEMDKACNRANAIAERVIRSIRTVYSFVAEKRSIKEFDEALDEIVKVGIRQGLAKGLAVGSNGLVFAIWAFLAWYGSRLVVYKGENGGKVFASALSLVQAGLSLGSALSHVKHIMDAIVAINRMQDMVDTVFAPKTNKKGIVLGNVHGDVVFKDVGFSYPSRCDAKVLSKFSLNIEAGKKVALVGRSGSGKSTVISLLERFYDPLMGEIMIDGMNLRALDVSWWRNQVGLVSQEPALFGMSIMDNISIGVTGEALLDDIVASAKASGAHSFIALLPNGYHTHVGEGGLQMSGGQKQRIAIARALIRNPRILLLDEATSALDAKSEKEVQCALHKASANRTTLMVSHRLYSVVDAHLIAVLQDGSIVEKGTHSELLSKPQGAYKALWGHQQSHIVDNTQFHELHHHKENYLKGFHSSFPSSYHALEEHGPDEIEKGDVSFFKLMILSAPEWKHATIGSICAMISGAVQPVYAYALGSMISAFFITNPHVVGSKIRYCALVFSCLSLLSFLVNVVQFYCLAVMGETLTKRVRSKLLETILDFEVAWFDKQENASGAVFSKLVTGANAVKSLTADRISLIAQTLSAIALAISLGSIVAWRLALVMMAVQPLTILCFYTRKVLLSTMSKSSIKAQVQGCQIAGEAISNHRTITAFSCSDIILRMFESKHDKDQSFGMRRSWLAGCGIASAQSVTYLTWALDFWYGGLLVQRGLVTAEDVFKTFFILVSTGRVIAEAATMTSDLAKSSASLNPIFHIMNRITRIHPQDRKSAKPTNIKGDVAFENVDFAYPSRPSTLVLQSINLQIGAGRSLAIVGPSGSGKSSVVSLLQRFYDPTRGCIKIDGLDLRSLNLRETRKCITWIGQEPVLIAGTIRDNILYGNLEATEAEMVEAAIGANAHTFISGLGDGYDTECGEGGVELSGGQKQRLAIARAMMKRPSIVLVDEATSALDGASKSIVCEALVRFTKGRSNIIVAHHLSTVAWVDHIAFIQHGRIVELGSFSDLINHGGAFASLFAAQSCDRSQTH